MDDVVDVLRDVLSVLEDLRDGGGGDGGGSGGAARGQAGAAASAAGSLASFKGLKGAFGAVQTGIGVADKVGALDALRTLNLGGTANQASAVQGQRLAQTLTDNPLGAAVGANTAAFLEDSNRGRGEFRGMVGDSAVAGDTIDPAQRRRLGQLILQRERNRGGAQRAADAEFADIGRHEFGRAKSQDQAKFLKDMEDLNTAVKEAANAFKRLNQTMDPGQAFGGGNR